MKSKVVRVLKLSTVISMLALPLFGQQDAAFFRVVSPTNSKITAFSGGTLAWTNAATGVTCTVQRATTLIGSSNWVDYVKCAASNAVMSLQVFDPAAPSDMAYIPAGSFNMGDVFGEGYASEWPVHSVYVSGFYMGKTETTKAQWDDVYNWAITHGYSFTNAGSGKASSHPVQTVSWYDCVKWCNARSEKEGKTPCYTVDGNVYRTGQSAPDCNWSAGGYRLPTEAEWEKAARGGLSGKRFPWGDTIQHTRANYFSSSSYSYDTSSTRGYHPTYNDGVYPYTSPAGSFAANGYGLYDMAGNVWEWCWDWREYAYYTSSPSSNPRGASSGDIRALRGGCWIY
ncbi:MAG: SUMF1/EgtB/PvdO family nonheme iron enzyme, partial [Kiritimatiellales bacterium]